MLKFKEATPRQQSITKALLKMILKIANCDENYRILEHEGNLMIRESTGNPPPERRRIRLMFLLASSQLLSKSGQIKVHGHLGESVTIPVFFITEINPILLEILLKKIVMTKPSTKKPDDVNEITWSHLPNEITLRWERFSDAMKEHLIKCVEVDLSTLFAAIPEKDRQYMQHTAR